MTTARKTFIAPDGKRWGAEVTVPSYSNVMLLFVHPDQRSGRRDRYSWLNWRGPEAANVTASLEPIRVLDTLTDENLAELFRHSMPINPQPYPEGLAVQSVPR